MTASTDGWEAYRRLADQHGFGFTLLEQVDPVVAALIPLGIQRENGILAFGSSDGGGKGTLFLAVDHPQREEFAEELRFQMSRPLKLFLVPRAALAVAWERVARGAYGPAVPTSTPSPGTPAPLPGARSPAPGRTSPAPGMPTPASAMSGAPSQGAADPDEQEEELLLESEVVLEPEMVLEPEFLEEVDVPRAHAGGPVATVPRLHPIDAPAARAPEGSVGAIAGNPMSQIGAPAMVELPSEWAPEPHEASGPPPESDLARVLQPVRDSLQIEDSGTAPASPHSTLELPQEWSLEVVAPPAAVTDEAMKTASWAPVARAREDGTSVELPEEWSVGASDAMPTAGWASAGGSPEVATAAVELPEEWGASAGAVAAAPGTSGGAGGLDGVQDVSQPDDASVVARRVPVHTIPDAWGAPETSAQAEPIPGSSEAHVPDPQSSWGGTAPLRRSEGSDPVTHGEDVELPVLDLALEPAVPSVDEMHPGAAPAWAAQNGGVDAARAPGGFGELSWGEEVQVAGGAVLPAAWVDAPAAGPAPVWGDALLDEAAVPPRPSMAEVAVGGGDVEAAALGGVEVAATDQGPFDVPSRVHVAGGVAARAFTPTESAPRVHALADAPENEGALVASNAVDEPATANPSIHGSAPSSDSNDRAATDGLPSAWGLDRDTAAGLAKADGGVIQQAPEANAAVAEVPVEDAQFASMVAGDGEAARASSDDPAVARGDAFPGTTDGVVDAPSIEAFEAAIGEAWAEGDRPDALALARAAFKEVASDGASDGNATSASADVFSLHGVSAIGTRAGQAPIDGVGSGRGAAEEEDAVLATVDHKSGSAEGEAADPAAIDPASLQTASIDGAVATEIVVPPAPDDLSSVEESVVESALLSADPRAADDTAQEVAVHVLNPTRGFAFDDEALDAVIGFGVDAAAVDPAVHVTALEVSAHGGAAFEGAAQVVAVGAAQVVSEVDGEAFDDSAVDGVVGEGPVLVDAAAVGSAVDGAAVEGAAVEGAAVEGVAVEGAAVDDSAVDGAAVEGIAVESVAVEGVAVEGVAVEGVAVEGAAVEGAALVGPVLEGAAVEGAAVEGVAVEGVAVEGPALTGAAQVAGALEGSAFGGASLDGPAWEAATFDGGSLNAPLDGAAREAATFDGGAQEAATFDGGSLDAPLDGGAQEAATFDGGSLGGASLDAPLDGAAREAATFESASLDGASLEGAPPEGASLDGAPPDGARQESTTFEGASLDGAPDDGAAVDGTALEPARFEATGVDGAALDSTSSSSSVDASVVFAAEAPDADQTVDGVLSSTLDDLAALPAEGGLAGSADVSPLRVRAERSSLDETPLRDGSLVLGADPSWRVDTAALAGSDGAGEPGEDDADSLDRAESSSVPAPAVTGLDLPATADASGEAEALHWDDAPAVDSPLDVKADGDVEAGKGGGSRALDSATREPRAEVALENGLTARGLDSEGVDSALEELESTLSPKVSLDDDPSTPSAFHPDDEGPGPDGADSAVPSPRADPEVEAFFESSLGDEFSESLAKLPPEVLIASPAAAVSSSQNEAQVPPADSEWYENWSALEPDGFRVATSASASTTGAEDAPDHAASGSPTGSVAPEDDAASLSEDALAHDAAADAALSQLDDAWAELLEPTDKPQATHASLSTGTAERLSDDGPSAGATSLALEDLFSEGPVDGAPGEMALPTDSQSQATGDHFAASPTDEAEEDFGSVALALGGGLARMEVGNPAEAEGDHPERPDANAASTADAADPERIADDVIHPAAELAPPRVEGGEVDAEDGGTIDTDWASELLPDGPPPPPEELTGLPLPGKDSRPGVPARHALDFSDEDLQILESIERIADGSEETPGERVRPARMVASLVRLLLRKGVINESEFLAELSRK